MVRHMETLLLALLLAVRAQGGAEQPETDVRALLDKVDDLFRGDSSHARMTMRVSTAHWKRELKIEVWSRGKARSLIRILAPKKEAGTATLKVGNDIWNYLPKVKRVIKLPSSMMGDAWMGSHFTNDDLVKDSRMADDYECSVTFRGNREGEAVTEVTCFPKAKAAVVWGKVTLTIRDADAMPLRILYCDEDLKPARVMAFSEFRDFGGRLLPGRCRIVPSDKPGESTEIIYESLDFSPDLPADMFSLRSLQK